MKSHYGVRNWAQFFNPVQSVKLCQGSDLALTAETTENSRQRLSGDSGFPLLQSLEAPGSWEFVAFDTKLLESPGPTGRV